MKFNNLKRLFTIIHAAPVTPIISKLAAGFGLLASASFVHAAECTLTIPDNWNTGFKAEIVIQNTFYVSF